MALQYFRFTAPDQLPAPSDCDAVNALVTAGAFVALADGQISSIERDEVVRYIDRRGFAATRLRIAALFDERAGQLQNANFANVILEALRPVPNLSLISDVMRISERVAAADGRMHPDEVQMLKLIRLIIMSFPEPKVIEARV
jgi:tellurite resistance protein